MIDQPRPGHLQLANDSWNAGPTHAVGGIGFDGAVDGVRVPRADVIAVECSYSIPDGVMSPKPGSVIEAMYAEIRRRGGRASHEQLLTVGERHLGPRTGEPMGRQRSRNTIWWLLNKGRLKRSMPQAGP